MTIERLRYDDQPERLPPHNLEAEEAVLGSVLLDRETITRVAPIVETRDFYRPRNAAVYAAMLALDRRDEPVDYLTLIEELDRSGQLHTAGGTTYVAGLLGAVPTPIHAEHYAQTIADCAFMRRLISAGGKIATIGFQNQLTTEQAMERCEQLLADVLPTGTVGRGMRPQVEVVGAVMERLRAIADRDPQSLVETGVLPTMFKELDELLGGGMARGELVLLAGRPGSGKSALMATIVKALGLEFGLQAAIFTMEMSAESLVERQLSAESGVPLRRFRDGKLSPPQQYTFGKAQGALAEASFWWDETPTQSIAALRAKARRQDRIAPLDIVVVDHLQLMDADGDNRVHQIAAITRGLKAIARDLNVVVLGLSQLSRSIEQRSDKDPQLSDLRDGGSLEQDADVVMFLTREEMWDPETERKGIADLHVLKNRNGQTGKLALSWNRETTAFRGMEFYAAAT